MLKIPKVGIVTPVGGNNPLTNTEPTGMLLSDCVSCNFFKDALSPVNQTVDFSKKPQTRDFFGDQFFDLPGHSNQMAAGQLAYLGSVYDNNVVAGANGFAITFAVSFWGPYKGACGSDVFCLGNLTYNLFQFTDTKPKDFIFDTSFEGTVALRTWGQCLSPSR